MLSDFIDYHNVAYSWADMTPILSFTTIIPLSRENFKKVLHPLYILIYPLKWRHPLKIYLIQRSLYHSPKSYIQLGWYDTYFILYDYYTPFNGKFKKSVTSSVNFNIPLEMTSPPHNISYSAFIISFTKKLHTVGLIWHLFYLLRL